MQIKNIQPDGLTIIYVKKPHPTPAEVKAINELADRVNMRDHVIFMFAEDANFQKVSEVEMNDMGWIYKLERDEKNKLRIEDGKED